MVPDAERSAIAATLAQLSAAWRERRFADLAGHFDQNAVIALPTAGVRLEGREAAVESYREFMSRAEITEYREDPPVIDVWGDTAVASVRWEIAWLAGGAANRESGHDVFVLRRTPADGTWRAVWRTMLTK